MARRAVLMLVGVVFAWLLLPGFATAQESGDADGAVPEPDEEAAQSIGGTLAEGVGPDRSFVVGAEIVVRQDGQVVGDAVSGDDGRWRVGLAEPGFYEVELVVDSLPEGVSLTDADRSILSDVEVRPGQSRNVVFSLGERIIEARSRVERLLSLLAKGVSFGAVIALSSIGLSLIFGVTGLVNFAHGELVTFGAIAAWFFNAAGAGPGWHITVAILPAVVLCAALGSVMEKGLFLPLRRRRTGHISLIVVTIGLSLFVRHLYLVFMGGGTRPYLQYTTQRERDYGPISMAPKDLVIIAVSVVLMVLVGLFLTRTRIGTAMRAVADNPDLAAASGIDVNRVIHVTWVMGAVLAGLGGVFYGISTTVQWDMGFTLLLMIFAAVVLGGLGTAFGAMVGGLLIGSISEVSTYWFAVEFKVVTALVVMILMLLIRPQGLFGIRERTG